MPDGYKVEKNEETVTQKFDVFSTTAFQVKLKKEVIEKFVEKLEKKDKHGNNKIPTTQHKIRKMDFIQKKMKPIASNCTGEDYEQSRRALFKAVFGESPDL